jgi:hypothetical protein
MKSLLSIKKLRLFNSKLLSFIKIYEISFKKFSVSASLIIFKFEDLTEKKKKVVTKRIIKACIG